VVIDWFGHIQFVNRDLNLIAVEPSEAQSAKKSEWAERFDRDGYAGPIPLLAEEERRAFLRHVESGKHPAPLDWAKGRAATDRVIYALAARPFLLKLLKPLLGQNIILWGAQVLRRKPGQVHPWHSDIESCSPDGRFVSVWVGLRGTSRASSLQLISGSHTFRKSIQEVRCEGGTSRDALDADMLLGWARQKNAGAELVEFDMTDGVALFFDGRLWHGSHNRNPERERMALLLQYAAADQVIRIPEGYEWPFRQQGAPRPPVILVCGSADSAINRIVPPPVPCDEKRPMVTTSIRRLELPLAENTEKGWRPYHLFHGPTRILDQMGCHVSVLSPGRSPHPPHAHREEELLMVLEGEAELVIATSPDDPSPRFETLRPGQVIYYPAFQHHTLRNASESAVTYLMFKWYAIPLQTKNPLGTEVFDYRVNVFNPVVAFTTQRIFSHATECLGKLHAHVTCLQPGGGYASHVDAYDVAIIVLSGEVETLGEVVASHSVIYYSAGEPHGMKNVGEVPAYYLVFEFHTSGTAGSRKPEKTNKKKKPASKLQKLLKIPRRLIRAVLG